MDFFLAIFLEKQVGKNPPKNARFSRKLFDQNPLRVNFCLDEYGCNVNKREAMTMSYFKHSSSRPHVWTDSQN